MVRLKVPMERLGLAAVDRAGVVSTVAVELATKARELVREAKLDGTEVSVGHVISNAQQSECGVFLQNGLRIGAVATVRCVSAAAELEVKVGPLAKLEHWLVWFSLGSSLVAGLVGAAILLPVTMAPGLRFGLGLLGGVAVGVAAIPAIARFGVGREKAGSEQLAVALEALVRKWSASKA